MFTTNTKLISEGVADDEQLNTVEAFREFASTSSAFKEFEEKQQDARNQVELEKIDIVMNNIDKAIKRLQSFPEENLTSASLVSIDEKIKSLQYILNNPKSLAELENADKELTIFLDDLVAEAQRIADAKKAEEKRIADAKKADEELLNKVNTELSIIDQHINKLKTYVRENLSTLSPDLMPLILEKVSILKTTKNESSSDNKSEKLKALRKVNEEISNFILDNNIVTKAEEKRIADAKKAEEKRIADAKKAELTEAKRKEKNKKSKIVEEAVGFMLGGDDSWSNYPRYSVDGCIVKHDEPAQAIGMAVGLGVMQLQKFSFRWDFNKAKWSSSSYTYDNMWTVKGSEGFSLVRGFDDKSNDISEDLYYYIDILGGGDLFNSTVIKLPVITSQDRFEKALRKLKKECPGIKSDY